MRGYIFSTIEDIADPYRYQRCVISPYSTSEQHRRQRKRYWQGMCAVALTYFQVSSEVTTRLWNTLPVSPLIIMAA